MADEVVSTSVSISREVRAELDRRPREEVRSVSALVERLLRDHLGLPPKPAAR